MMGRRPWLVVWAALFAAMASWSLASPLMSGPDEPAQLIRAASLVRGQLLGQHVGGPSSPTTRVRVPVWLAGANRVPLCYRGEPSVPASCAPQVSAAGGSAWALTYTGRYPPLYYALVGWPTLFLRGPPAVYLVRLVACAVVAVLLAGALWCAGRSRRRPGLLMGLALTITPQVLFLGSVVNPSGLELGAAVCVWAAGLVAGEAGDEASTWWMLGSAAVLANVRGLSPFWLALMGASLGAWWGREGLARVLRTRASRLGLPLVAAAGTLAVAWVLGAGALHTRPSSLAAGHPGALAVLGIEAANVFVLAPQFVAGFGWTDTYLPAPVYVLWLGALLVLVAGAARRASGRHRLVIVGLTGACFLVPTLLTFSEAGHLGVFGQARDWMPLWLGLPMVAGASLPAGLNRRAGWLVSGVAGGAIAVQGLSWWWALERYRYQPPLPAAALGVVLMGSLLVAAVVSGRWRDEEGGAISIPYLVGGGSDG
jgi:hypothetical protein